MASWSRRGRQHYDPRATGLATSGTGSTGVGNQDDGIDLRGSFAIIGGTGVK